MKRPQRLITILALIVIQALPLTITAQELLKYVNPMIGTGGTGHTFPGCVRPFAMVQLSPDTRIDESWEGCSGYHYSDDTIYGFSHTHLSGTGCSDLGDIAFMPSFSTNKNYASYQHDSVFATFNHVNEKTTAGYYSVTLDNGIRVELTSTERVGLQKYKFPNAGGVWVTLNLDHRDVLLDGRIKLVSTNHYKGFRRSKAWAKDQTVYYDFEMSLNPEDAVVKQFKDGQSRIDFYFRVKAGEELLIKTALSAVSEAGAGLNMKTELPGWDFENVKKASESTWEQHLQKIKVFGGSETDKIKFYTALYHCMIHPSVLSDVDSSFRGRDGNIYKAHWGHYYSIFSLWDTYRALHPLLNIVEPSISRQFIKTFQAQYEQSGRLPMWELWGYETDCMIGMHSIPVILDAYAKGVIDSTDLAAIYPAIKAELESNRFGLDKYREKGYLEITDEHESVSKTLEYAYDFWCAWKMANEVKDYDNLNKYKNLSYGGFNLWDDQLQLVRPRRNGGWLEPFDPAEVNNNFTEGNSWQYSFYFPQYLNSGLGLNDSVVERIFLQNSETKGRQQADLTGMIGQYAHGNEPSHHIPYLMSQEKTTKMVSKICSELYGTDENGLCGNDDCGQMSAWYVFSAMGFYPVCPGTNTFYWGNMLFDSISIPSVNLEFHRTTSTNSNNYYTSKYFEIDYWKSNSTRNYLFGKEKTVGIYSVMPHQADMIFPAPLASVNKDTLKVRYMPPIEIGSEPHLYNSSPKYSVKGPDRDTFFLIKPMDSLKFSEPGLPFAFYIGNDHYFPTTLVYHPKVYRYGIKLLSRYNRLYTADGDSGIVDGVYGNQNWRTGGWQGYQGQDFNCILDLNKSKKVNSVSFNCLQDTKSWILFPREVQVWASTNGKRYKLLGKAINTFQDSIMSKTLIQEMKVKVSSKKRYRYLKITAINYGKLPAWHPGKGGDAFIFVDEITVE